MINALLYCSLFSIALISQESLAKESHFPPLLRAVEKKYKESKTFFAKFIQVNDQPILKKRTTSTGYLLFKQPGKIRWETQAPDPNLLVSDGKKYWFYTPPFDKDEQGQVIEKKASQVQSQLANALLSGSFSKVKSMKIKKKAKNKFQLTPEPGTAGDLEKAEIEVDLKKQWIKKVTLEHKSGNRSEITLTDIELGKKLEDSLFTFTPPPGTEKVTE